jgi:carbamoyltransferase
MSVRILGLSAYYHDSAAALVEDGRIVAAAQEERFTRVKGDAGFPHHAVGFCLDVAGVSLDRVDHVVFYERPLLKFERLMMTQLKTAPRSLRGFLAAMPDWLTRKLWLERDIASELGVRKRVAFVDHHLSHAASAFYPSPYQDAAILTIDGVGEWATATWGYGRGGRITLAEEMRFPNSWGLLYSAFTHYCGFKINAGEYKLMGLAPYGRPLYMDRILDHVIRLHDDGSATLNQAYFSYATGLRTTNERFHSLFGGPPRRPESLLTQRDMDLAASIQAVLNEAVLRMGRHVHRRTGLDHLTLAGGVALNCVATGKLASEGPFKSVWTQPAAGDAGGALGAALAYWHMNLGHDRVAATPDAMRGAFLGWDIPPQSEADDRVLHRLGAVWEDLDDEALARRIAAEVAAGRIVGLARGRAEFGPRALGARSILGDARSPTMQSRMNQRIKFREGFRPFAPMVLADEAAGLFSINQESPYMLLVFHVREEHRKPAAGEGLWGIELLKQPRSTIPAVTHVDHSARIQTVDSQRNPFMHTVLSRFREATGCGVVVNTSFNVRSEPIVNTAEDAFRCFMATEIDCLVVGNRFMDRQKQAKLPLTEAQRAEWLRRFVLD